MKVIACTNDERTEYEYLAYDSGSGGYPYWTRFLSNAYIFRDDDQDRLAYEMGSILNNPDREFSDGTTYPNLMKGFALGLRKDKPKGKGTIFVLEVSLTPIEQYPIEGEIKKV